MKAEHALRRHDDLAASRGSGSAHSGNRANTRTNYRSSATTYDRSNQSACHTKARSIADCLPCFIRSALCPYVAGKGINPPRKGDRGEVYRQLTAARHRTRRPRVDDRALHCRTARDGDKSLRNDIIRCKTLKYIPGIEFVACKEAIDADPDEGANGNDHGTPSSLTTPGLSIPSITLRT